VPIPSQVVIDPPRKRTSDLVVDGYQQFLDSIGMGAVQETPKDRLPLLEWTERYRSLGGVPLLPSTIPWLRDLYAHDAREIVVMKASQVFISEWMVNTALWVCDTAQGGRGNALYVFPTQREANDFSQGRVDPAVNESPYLAERTGAIYEDRMGRRRNRASAARVTLKRVGRGFFYLRGGDKRRQLLTVDADGVFLDEVDEYRRGTIDLARQRLNSALDPLVRMVSTPKFPSSGIAPIYAETNRMRYFIPCGRCGKRQPLDFPENLTPDGKLVCVRCGGPLRQTAEGEWVPEKKNWNGPHGFHVSRLYSTRADLKELARIGYAILDKTETEPGTIQEFYNQSLGLPHAPAGGSLTDEILNTCRADYEAPAPVTGTPVTMGIDVGGVLHYWIKGPAPDQQAKPGATRLLECGVLPNEVADDGTVWPHVGDKMRQYRVRLAVVDALPEDERSARFTEQWYGYAYRCFYHDESQWRYAGASAWNPKEHVVHAQRTRVMDSTFHRFHHLLEELPRDAQHVRNLYAHLKAPVRVLVEDAKNRTVARYQEGLAADHLAHAAVYAELGRQFMDMPGAPEPPHRLSRKRIRVKV
jgi:hypothetical protein